MAESEKKITGPRRKRRNRWAFPLGLAIIALALVGTATLISFGVTGIKNLTNNTALKAEYEEFLLPVVMNDPDPFDDISKANMFQLIHSSIYKFTKDTSITDLNKYIFEGIDNEGLQTTLLRIPKDDVDIQFEKLFGSKTPPNYTNDFNFSDSSEFYYDETLKNYEYPISGGPEIYTPKIDFIDKKGDSIILTVGYIGVDDWLKDDKGNYLVPEPNKWMKITLRVTDGDPGYYVSAIQDMLPPDYSTLTTKPNKHMTTTTEPKSSEKMTSNITTTVTQSSTTGEKTTVKEKTSKSTTTKSTTVKNKTAGN